MPGTVRSAGAHCRLVLSLACLGALAACDEPTAPPRVLGIVLTPVLDTIAVGQTLQVAANVLGVSGSTLSGHPVDWTSSAPSVATISSSGLVSALSAGTTIISAKAGDQTRTATIVVQPPACTTPAGPPLSIGGSQSSAMNASPCLLFTNLHAVGFPMTISAATGARMNITASGFQPGIVLMNSTGFIVAASFPGSPNPSLRPVLDPGSYQVWVVSNLAPSASMTFTLSATLAGGRCEDGTVTRSLDLGNTSAAAVNDLSCVLLDGPIAEGWRITLTEPTHIRVTASSAAFGPTVAVTSADYQQLITYSISATPGTRGVNTALPAGDYLVWGGSFDFSSGTVQVGVEVVPPCVASGTLALGVPQAAALAVTDCRSLSSANAYADVWTLTLATPTQVQIDHGSNDFDAYLELRDASDVLITADDDAGGMLNSRIVRTLAAGTYRVWATSYDFEGTGAYTLTATALGGALRLERAPAPARGISSPSGKRERPASRPWPARPPGGTGRK